MIRTATLMLNVASGALLAFILIRACTPSYNQDNSALSNAANAQPFADGQTIEGMVAFKQRGSYFSGSPRVPGVVEYLTFQVRRDIGDGCFRVSSVDVSSSPGSEAASRLDELTAVVELGGNVRVSGIDPLYRGERTCNATYGGVAVQPSQIQVVR